MAALLSLATVALSVLALVTSAAPPHPDAAAAAAGKVLLCYWGSWSTYRWGAGLLEASMIDPNTCTHLVYTFAGLDDRTLEIKSLDPWNDLPAHQGGGKDNYNNLVNLKRYNSELKVLLAVGGWNEGSVKYSRMAASPSTRRTFVTSVVRLLTQHGFDGLDLDWEWPGARGGVPADKQNYVQLVKELSAALREKGMTLSAAAPAAPTGVDVGFDIPAIMPHLDFLSIMSYDYHTAYQRLDHPTPLRGKTPTQLTVSKTLEHYLARGAQPEKLLLGLTTYSRSFTLRSAAQHNVGDAANGPGQAGMFSQERGLLTWYELCEKMVNEKLTLERDPEYDAPFAYSATEWYAYDDETSLAEKVKYAKENKLGGVMIWSLENDDNSGVCGNSLASSVRKAIDS